MCTACNLQTTSNDPDPVALELSTRSHPDVSLQDLVAMVDRIKWAYPMKDNKPQGNHDWFCWKTVEVRYTNMNCNEVRKLLTESEHEQERFKSRRMQIVRICIDLGGHTSTDNLRRHEDVVVLTTAGIHHIKRGRCMSVAKYTRVTGHAPKPSQIQTKRSRSTNMLVQYVKVYKDEDSDEWSFEEDEAQVVQRSTTLDDGRFVLDKDQLQDTYGHATAAILGTPNSKKTSRTTLDDIQQLAREKDIKNSGASSSVADTIVDNEDQLEEDVEHHSAIQDLLTDKIVQPVARPKATAATAAAQGKAKGKATGKVATPKKGGGKKLTEKQQQNLREEIASLLQDARGYKTKTLESSTLDGLNELAVIGKDVSKRLVAKEAFFCRR